MDISDITTDLNLMAVINDGNNNPQVFLDEICRELSTPTLEIKKIPKFGQIWGKLLFISMIGKKYIPVVFI
jgi:hypothetical protein